MLTGHIPTLKNNEMLREQKVINIDAPSPDIVENKLRSLGFENLNAENSMQDMMLSYFSQANAKFKRGSKNLKKLQNDLMANDTSDDAKLGALFNYLLEESNLEIRRLQTINKSKVDINNEPRMIDKEIESETELENAIVSELFKPTGKDGETYLMNTDFIYEILTDLNNRKKPLGAKVLSIDQLVEAFELAKTVPIEGRRRRGIFLAGNLIYSLGKVRMDPVNESFYIESLVNYGLYKKAYNLFESVREKVNERWWYEMGMMIALRGNYLRKLDTLLAIADKKFDSYPYIAPKMLQLAIKKKLYIRDFESANALSDRYLEIISKYGLKCSSDRDHKMIKFESEGEADEYLNEIEVPTIQGLLTIIDYHFFRKNFDMGYKLMASYLEKTSDDEVSLQYLIVRLKLNLLRNMNGLKVALEPHIPRTVAKNRLRNLQRSFNKMVGKMNVDPTICQELLFDSISSLVQNPLLTKTVEGLLVSSMKEEALSPSKSFRGLIKLLLATGREKDAMKLLTNMEHAFKNSQDLTRPHENQFYTPANAHHYAEFVEYYTILAARGKSKRPLVTYEKNISKLLARMEVTGVSYNAVFLAKLLVFYKGNNDFGNLFKIINEILEDKHNISTPADANRTSFYGRRDITRGLYAEIWNAYSRYYYVYSREWQTIGKKSNYLGWRNNVSKIMEKTKIHPSTPIRTLFANMINADNILPDERMYFVILVTFMKKREWEAIPGVLTAMESIHGLPISDELVNYFMKGLEREYIMAKRRKIDLSGQGDQEINSSMKQFIQQLKKNAVVQKPESGDPNTVNILIENILALQRYKSPSDHDFSQVTEAMKAMQCERPNMQDLIYKVQSKDSIM